MKRLQHKRFCLAVMDDERINIEDIEMFDISAFKNNNDSTLLFCSNRNLEGLKMEMFINYTTRHIEFILNEYNERLIELIEKYYYDKDYDVEINEKQSTGL